MAISAAGDLRRPLKVVLVAEEAAGILALRWMAAQEALRWMAAQEKVELVAVLTATQGETKRRPGMADAARHLGCTLLPSEQVRDPTLARWIRSEGVDLLINVHSVHLIHGDVVAAPRIGSFNLHPGPLPGYAGLNAPSWAIFNGEQRHAVTLHWMAAGIDTGAIAYDAWFHLDPTATGLSASLQCVRLGLPLVEALFATALAEPAAIPARPQDRAKRRYYKRSEVPFDGKLDCHRSAASLDAFIRAANYHPMASPWGHPATCLDSVPLGSSPLSAPDGRAMRRQARWRPAMRARSRWRLPTSGSSCSRSITPDGYDPPRSVSGRAGDSTRSGPAGGVQHDTALCLER